MCDDWENICLTSHSCFTAICAKHGGGAHIQFALKLSTLKVNQLYVTRKRHSIGLLTHVNKVDLRMGWR